MTQSVAKRPLKLFQGRLFSRKFTLVPVMLVCLYVAPLMAETSETARLPSSRIFFNQKPRIDIFRGRWEITDAGPVQGLVIRFVDSNRIIFEIDDVVLARGKSSRSRINAAGTTVKYKVLKQVLQNPAFPAALIVLGKSGEFTAVHAAETDFLGEFDAIVGAFERVDVNDDPLLYAFEAQRIEPLGRTRVFMTLKRPKGKNRRKVRPGDTYSFTVVVGNLGPLPVSNNAVLINVFMDKDRLVQQASISAEDHVSCKDPGLGVPRFVCLVRGLGPGIAKKASFQVNVTIPATFPGRRVVFFVEAPAVSQTRRIFKRLPVEIDRKKIKGCQSDGRLPCIQPSHSRTHCQVQTSFNLGRTLPFIGVGYFGVFQDSFFGLIPHYAYHYGETKAEVFNELLNSLLVNRGDPLVGYVIIAKTNAGKMCKYFKRRCANFDNLSPGSRCGFDGPL